MGKAPDPGKSPEELAGQADRQDVRAAQSPVRCPYCHEDVEPSGEEWLACRDCLARHHEACWNEGGVCSACGSTSHLGKGEDARLEPVRAPQQEATLRDWLLRSRRELLVAGALLCVILVYLALRTSDPHSSAAMLHTAPHGPACAEIMAASKLKRSNSAAFVLGKISAKGGMSEHEWIYLIQTVGELDGPFAALNVLQDIAARGDLGEEVQICLIHTTLNEIQFADHQVEILTRLIRSGKLTPNARLYLTERLDSIRTTSGQRLVLRALTDSR